MAESLASRHPWRLDIPLLLAVSFVLLVRGLMMPALEIRALIFWRDEYSIISNIEHFNRSGKHEAAIILALCSVVYPAVKIAALYVLWLAPFSARWRGRFVRLLRLLGRWSMLDVFAVTALVVGSQTVALLDASPLPGIYVYAAGIIVLMIATVLMDRLAHRGQRPRRRPR